MIPPAEFLPNDPPPAVLRGLAWLLVALAGVAGVAATTVRIPETIRCPFVLAPDAGMEPVQSPLAGPAVVARVTVSEGQTVEEGETLFALRSDEVRATRLRLATAEEEAQGIRARAAKLDELLAGELKLKDEEYLQVEREIAFRSRHLAATRDLLDRNRRLAADRLISEVELQRHELAVVESEKDEVVAQRGLQQIVLQRRQLETGRLRQRTDEESELRKLATTIASLRQELLHGEDDRLTIRAPYRGVVVSLARHAVGDVVTGNAELCRLVRADAPLHARLTLPDQGPSRMSPGQPVRLFFDAFPHARFGIIPASVAWVSPGAIPDGTGPRFIARAALERTGFTTPDGPRAVLPGMTGTARVLVGRRTPIEFVFEPLRQLRDQFHP